MLPIGAQFAQPFAKWFTLAGDSVYFASNTTNGWGLYKSNGTLAGTILVKDLSNLVTYDPSLRDHAPFVEAGGKLFFTAYEAVSNRVWQLWCSDGTELGTQIVPGVLPYGLDVPWLASFENKLVTATLNSTFDVDIISTDGTVAGTTSLVPLLVPGHAREISNLFTLNGELHFVTYPLPPGLPTSGNNLQKLNSSTGQIELLFENYVSSWSNAIWDIKVAGDRAHFVAQLDGQMPRIWVTDGTAAGTVPLTPDSFDFTGHKPEFVPLSGPGLLYSAYDVSAGVELMSSDGTPGGSEVVCDLEWPGSSYPSLLTLHNGSLFFMARTLTAGYELFHLPLAAPYSTDLGTQFANGATLRSTMPKLGVSLTVSCDDVPPAHSSLLLMSGSVASPMTLFTSSASASWLAPNSVRLLASFATTSWDWTVNLPSFPGLVGATFHLQNFMLPGGALPAETSNGLVLVLGN